MHSSKGWRALELRRLLPLLFLLSPNWAVGQAISNNFYTAQRLNITGVVNVMSGDLNNDGKPDLVALCLGVPQTGAFSVEVWINTGNGHFILGQQIAVSSTTNPTLADLNADGIPDLIYGDPNDGTVLDVALGTGQGTFSAPNAYTGRFGVGSLSPVAVGDFNGDGKPDIAWSRGQAALSVFFNTGLGTFGPFQDLFVDNSQNALAVADMNHDGIQDLVEENSAPSGDVRVIYGSSSGTFSYGTVVPLASPSAMAVGDLNGDGYPDIVVGTTTDQFFHHGLTVLMGRADGTFTSQLIRNFLGPITSLMLRDLNGDGRLDLALTEQNAVGFSPGGYFDLSYLAVYPGNGDGSFQNPRTYNTDSDPVNVIAADIFGDGRPALITANDNTRDISILRSDVPGFYVAAPMTLSPHAEGIVTADFNRDGIMDVAVVNDPTCKAPCNGTVTVFLGTGRGWFNGGATYAIGMHGSGIAAGDLNGDGVLDLVVTNHTPGDNSDVSVLLGNANGTFQAAQNFTMGVSSSEVFLADMNRDGQLDLITVDGIALGTGTGSFGFLVSYATLGLGAVVDHIAVADFNQDGVPDVAATSISNAPPGTDDLTILENDGTGNVVMGPTRNVGASVRSIAAGNINGDAYPDIVVSLAGPATSGQLEVYLGGPGAFLSSVPGPPRLEAPGWNVAVADMNNDGFGDVVVTAGSSVNGTMLNDLIVIPGNGNGTFAASKSFTVLSGIRSRIAIADLDNDGRQDVLVSNDLGISRARNIGSRITP